VVHKNRQIPTINTNKKPIQVVFFYNDLVISHVHINRPWSMSSARGSMPLDNQIVNE